MIRMAGKDGEGAVELLGHYQAGESVRHRHGAERKKEPCLPEGCVAPSVGGPDGEYEVLRTLGAEAERCALGKPRAPLQVCLDQRLVAVFRRHRSDMSQGELHEKEHTAEAVAAARPGAA